jgi:hypothetical protein
MVELLMKVFDEPDGAVSKAKKAAEYIRSGMSMAKKIEDYEQLYLACINKN